MFTRTKIVLYAVCVVCSVLLWLSGFVQNVGFWIAFAGACIGSFVGSSTTQALLAYLTKEANRQHNDRVRQQMADRVRQYQPGTERDTR